MDDELPRRESATPCPVCDQYLVMEPLFSQDSVVVALVCPTHGVARMVDPFQ